MKLPIISGKELIKALEKAGFNVVAKKGSHVRMKKKLKQRAIVTTVPLHKELDTGTLIGILHQTEITREQFMKLMK